MDVGMLIIKIQRIIELTKIYDGKPIDATMEILRLVMEQAGYYDSNGNINGRRQVVDENEPKGAR